MKSNSFSFIISLILLFPFCENANAQSPDWLWAQTAGGSNFDYVTHSTTDANGNTYITGYFTSDAVTFGNITLMNATIDGNADIFIVSYDAAGNVIWAKSAGGNKGDWAYGIAADLNGNCYITGAFQSDSATFDSITIAGSGWGYGTFFLVKYDTAGNVIWAAHTEGGCGFNIAPDAHGNSYVTGYFAIPSMTFGSTVLTMAGAVDIFTVKYDSAGNVLWAKSAGGNLGEWGHDIVTDSSGNCYVTGAFNSASISFDGIVLSNNGSCTYCSDMFMVKYDAAGNAVWATNAGGTNADNGVAITADAGGNSYVTGYFNSDSITFGNTTLVNDAFDGSSDIFITKYDNDGNVLWATSAGGDSIDIGQGIAADAYGNCYVTGYFKGDSVFFDNTVLLNTNPGAEDVFFARYDPSGNVVWASSAGGNETDIGIGIGTDAAGAGYATGWYSSASIDFGSTSILNTNPGYADIYLAEFDIATGIAHAGDKNEISVFPNPTNGIMNISLNKMTGSGKVEVLGILGESFFSAAFSNESKMIIDLRGIPDGIYFIKVSDGENYYCRKIIVDCN